MLTDTQKREILELSNDGMSVRAIAGELGVPKSTIHDLVKGNTFKGFSLKKAQAPAMLNNVGGLKDKRVLVISDLHSGHKFGLTPPDWYVPGSGPEYMSFLRKSQEESWEFYSNTIKELGHIDILIVVGDLIDGKAQRSGGTEQLTCSLAEQRDIAEACIREVNADKIFMVRGTNYHTASDGEDNEDLIAERLGATIGDRLWLDINGIVFDLKHKVGSSSVPHGRATSIMKEATWNREWAAREGQPLADVFIRGHVHHHTFVGNSEYIGMTLPALQSPNTKYGARECVGVVDYGLVYFDVPAVAKDLNDISWGSKIKRLKTVAPDLLLA